MIKSRVQAALASLGLDRDEVYLETSLRMILLMLLIFVNDIYMFEVAIPVMVLPGLIINKITVNRFYWLFLASVFTVLYLIRGLDGYLPNHKYLYAYLIIAVVVVLFAKSNGEDWKRLFKKSARWIIGICFLLATIGKFVSPDFISGSFFEFTCLTDVRFHGLASVFTGMDLNVLFDGHLRFIELLNTSQYDATAKMPSAPRLTAVSLFLAYWTIFLEGMIAICYLAPKKYYLYRVREYFLLAFIFTTYPIATVSGFVTIISILAFIQSYRAGKSHAFTLLYLILFLSQPLFRLPFLRIWDRFLSFFT